MSEAEQEFFFENTRKVNKTVQNILVYANLVPLTLFIGTVIHLWTIPYSYCFFMLGYGIVNAAVCFILSHVFNYQKAVMYIGVIAASGFVAILEYKGFVRLSISYAFGTVISCLYYNRRLTVITCIVNFFLSLFLSYVLSFHYYKVLNGDYTQLQFFIQKAIGLTIEFTFLLFITSAIAKVSQGTLSKLMDSVVERNDAYSRLQKQNQMIKSINSELQVTNNELDETQFRIIQFVAQCLGSHDLFTGRHVIHTQRYVEVICNQLIKQNDYVEELDEKTIQLYKNAAFLHDIGKIHIPEGILNKIGKFTPEDFEIMQSHTKEGAKLLEYLPKIDNGDFNKIAIEMAYYHHEKWDGTGYPCKLKGTAIPLCARIMAAADVLDALISQRLYKEPMSLEDAIEVFKKSKDTHFEPCIADAVIASASVIALIDMGFKKKESSSNSEELEWWQRYHKYIQN